MTAPKGTVCSINVFRKLRLCFGFYSHIFGSERKRFVVKILLIAFSCYVAFIPEACSYIHRSNEFSFYALIRSIEYLAYVVCAAQSDDHYITEYFTIDQSIENKNYNNIYRIIPRVLFAYIALLFLCFTPYCFIYSKSSICETSLLTVLKLLYLRIGNEVGCLPLLMILLLFYCRVEIYCKRVREEVIKNTCEFEWRKYLYIYVNIKSALKKTDWPLKFMLFLHSFAGFIKISNIQFYLFRLITSHELANTDILYILGLLLCLVFIYLLIFLPSIIFELVIAKLENLRVQLADSMIACTDEHRRQNLLQLVRCLREQPPRYTLWRAVEVNARLPLAFLSLSVTFLVCIVQLSHIL